MGLSLGLGGVDRKNMLTNKGQKYHVKQVQITNTKEFIYFILKQKNSEFGLEYLEISIIWDGSTRRKKTNEIQK